MAKIEWLQRLLLFVHKLENGPKYVSSKELLHYLETNLQLRYGDIPGNSLRTIQRDIKAIDELFGIEIKYQKGLGYYIAERDTLSAGRCTDLLLNFDLLSALQADSDLNRYIQAEHHHPVDSLHLPLLLKAIRTKHKVSFDYAYFRKNHSIAQKIVSPYFLKESQERWYLVAQDQGQMKLFGVERMSHVNLLENESFVRDESIDIRHMFDDCFGIWNQTDLPVEDIELSFSALDGYFLKTMPLHHSQVILVDTDQEFRIHLRLRITNDFVMELLSRSASVTIIKPLSLRHRMIEIYKQALQRNESESIDRLNSPTETN